PPPRPTLFPYTTLFRSEPNAVLALLKTDSGRSHIGKKRRDANLEVVFASDPHSDPDLIAVHRATGYAKAFHLQVTDHLVETLERSEEHTSELQSRGHLV